MSSRADVPLVLGQLQAYCTRHDWRGWDPFDGLMLRVPGAAALRATRSGRLALIQLVKRSRVNLRPMLRIPELLNPKALALGLEAAVDRGDAAEAARLAGELLPLQRPSGAGAGWGYPFDWQSRSFWCPRDTPTVVCTGFVVRALDRALPMLPPALTGQASAAIDLAAKMVLLDLRRTEDATGFCFSYSPLDGSQVVNATLLGAEILARAAARRNDASQLEEARGTVAWSLARQGENGGWAYGSASHHRWEDSFHTGFNLLSLAAIDGSAQRLGAAPGEYVPAGTIERGLAHYAATFFEPDGFPRYYDAARWPADAHTAAVAILALTRLGGPRETAERVLAWAMAHLWDPQQTRFDYQVRRSGRVRTPFLRWSQAWMLAGLAAYSAR